MTPTMRQLEALVLVYRHGSLTKAAAELRVTQSAVSFLIRHRRSAAPQQKAARSQFIR
jgi:DNA-binding transcriptional LysR family regulator